MQIASIRNMTKWNWKMERQKNTVFTITLKCVDTFGGGAFSFLTEALGCSLKDGGF